ncbi:hypothetical protein RIF23_03545 [Lipingzhangella sp. LS1_29]|uniref:LapA family protein n=1 Tax=Lipingzhangella rawalii TaxID=2055835 RepID=A0ABU2H234_9ACTN|nr:hypothetical protein [Lipingzhangella rawalii]MDS1269365.1 hypothetical protein [Lipingzhangella rawalii]
MLTVVVPVAVFVGGLVLGAWLTAMTRTWTVGRLLAERDREIHRLRSELRLHRRNPETDEC